MNYLVDLYLQGTDLNRYRHTYEVRGFALNYLFVKY